jgi:hypothetical protein
MRKPLARWESIAAALRRRAEQGRPRAAGLHRVQKVHPPGLPREADPRAATRPLVDHRPREHPHPRPAAQESNVDRLGVAFVSLDELAAVTTSSAGPGRARPRARRSRRTSLRLADESLLQGENPVRATGGHSLPVPRLGARPCVRLEPELVLVDRSIHVFQR